MNFNEFKKVNAISFLKLASGSWRLKAGKKLTGGSIVVKTGSEEFACKLAREYLEEALRKRRVLQDCRYPHQIKNLANNPEYEQFR